jgi:transcriptional regulator with XRE-family HTH domain
LVNQAGRYPVPVSDGSTPSLGDFIRMQRTLADLSLRQLSDVAKVSNAYLSQVERGLYTPSAQVLKNIAEALHISTEVIYSRAGLLDDEGSEARAPDVEAAIRLDERLTAEQKDALLRVYRGFLS